MGLCFTTKKGGPVFLSDTASMKRLLPAAIMLSKAEINRS